MKEFRWGLEGKNKDEIATELSRRNTEDSAQETLDLRNKRVADLKSYAEGPVIDKDIESAHRGYAGGNLPNYTFITSEAQAQEKARRVGIIKAKIDELTQAQVQTPVDVLHEQAIKEDPEETQQARERIAQRKPWRRLLKTLRIIE